jgi:hypothetical protein
MTCFPFRRVLAAASFAVLIVRAPCNAGFEWGRVYPTYDNYTTIEVDAGVVTALDVKLLEARRELSDGDNWEVADTVRYEGNDFTMRGMHPDVGAHIETRFDFVTVLADGGYVKASSESTARRNYFIGVGQEIEYHDDSYGVMMIPEGNDFSTRFEGGLFDLRCAITPFGMVWDKYLWLNPSLDAGVFAVGGTYELDAGEPRGTTFYQNPPRQYVVGGEASWFLGMTLPQVGGGVEMRLGEPECLSYTAQAHVMVFGFSGNYPFTSTDSREENVSVHFRSIRLRNSIELPPFGNGSALTFNLNLAHYSAGGTSRTRPYPAPWDPGREQRVSKDYEFGGLEVAAGVGYTF